MSRNRDDAFHPDGRARSARCHSTVGSEPAARACSAYPDRLAQASTGNFRYSPFTAAKMTALEPSSSPDTSNAMSIATAPGSSVTAGGCEFGRAPTKGCSVRAWRRPTRGESVRVAPGSRNDTQHFDGQELRGHRLQTLITELVDDDRLGWFGHDVQLTCRLDPTQPAAPLRCASDQSQPYRTPPTLAAQGSRRRTARYPSQPFKAR